MRSKFITASKVMVLGLILITGMYAHGQANFTFDNVASLFEIGMGARPLGMGGAFVGLADDENAVFYNPASLAYFKKTGVTSLFSRQFDAFNYGAIGVAGRFLGLNLLQLDSGRIQITDEFGTTKGENFHYLSQAGIGSFGVSLGELLALGTRIKFFQAKLSKPIDEHGFGWSIDPAAMLKFKRMAPSRLIKDFRIGVLLENILSNQIKFNSGHSENWNPDLRIGLSATLEIIQEVSLNVLCDFNNLLNKSPLGHLGVELWANGLGVRAGLNHQGVSMGTSIWIENFRIDWAYITHYSKLPDGSRISLTFRF